MTLDNELTIRQAVPEDAAIVHTMVQGLADALGFPDHAKAEVEDLKKYGFGSTACFNALIAERNGKAIGMCTYFPTFSTWNGRPGVFVLDLYVAEQERSSGLGEILLAKVSKMSREWGATFLQLTVDDHNVRGQSFYRRIGFTPVKDECTYQINSEKFISLADQN